MSPIKVDCGNGYRNAHWWEYVFLVPIVFAALVIVIGLWVKENSE